MLNGFLAKPSRLGAEFQPERGGESSQGMRDLFSLPFLYSLVQIIDIIQCRMCHMQFPGEQCSKGRGICIAALDEACMVGTVVASKLWVGGSKKGRRKETGTRRRERKGGGLPLLRAASALEWPVSLRPS